MLDNIHKYLTDVTKGFLSDQQSKTPKYTFHNDMKQRNPAVEMLEQTNIWRFQGKNHSND